MALKPKPQPLSHNCRYYKHQKAKTPLTLKNRLLQQKLETVIVKIVFYVFAIKEIRSLKG